MPEFTGARFGFGRNGQTGVQVPSNFTATGGQITPGDVTSNGYTYHISVSYTHLRAHET